MQYSLRTLIIAMLLGGPALAGTYYWWLYARRTARRLGEVAGNAMIVAFFAATITATLLSVIRQPGPFPRLFSLATIVTLSASIGCFICPAIVNGREEA